VIDAGASVTWNSASWTDIAPITTAITVATRTGAVAVPDGTWTAWSAELNNGGGSTITSAANRYLQYRVTFTSGNAINTAQLNDVTILSGAVTGATLYGINGTDTTHVWAVGSAGTIVFYNGTVWAAQASGVVGDLKSVNMIVSNLGFAVGNSGSILKWNGTAWASMSSPTASALNSVSMDAGAAFGAAVGVGGVIAHYNGTAWATVASPTASELTSVSVITPTNAYAVGKGGVIVHWNGTAWSTMSSPVATDLQGVHMLNASLGFAVGAGGKIIKWNGSTWALQTSPTTGQLEAVEMRSASEAWAVGATGVILKYDGATWTSFASPSSRHLYALTVYAPTDGWISGELGEIIKDPGPYFLAGTFTSSVLDTDAGSATWDAFFASETLPANTSVTVAFRSGNVAVPDGTWTAWSSESAVLTGVQIPVAAARYLQYRATFATTDNMATPDFNDITVSYHK
ncbi:MAG: hypothetical protein RLZZ324_917, partial [Candidatus Parcubacteria bacterium]